MTFDGQNLPSAVLMATCNGGLHVAEQVSSVLCQEGAPLEIIIGEDNSTDNTVEVLAAIDPAVNLRIIRYASSSGGAGQSFLRLMCDIDMTKFKFVAFCDQDDIWSPKKLARAITFLEERDADGYSSAVTAFWPDGREKVLDQNPRHTDIDFLFEGAGQGCTFVLRNELARQVQQFVREHRGLLGAIHYHDWLIYAVSRTLGKRWAFDPEPSMRYRQHAGNDTGARGAFAGVRKRIGLISDGWYANQVRQMIAAVSALDATGVAIPSDFRSVWNRQRGLKRRMQLARVLFKRGRRRSSDRAVLAVAALLGWL
jgi:rhamnosyltransferase